LQQKRQNFGSAFFVDFDNLYGLKSSRAVMVAYCQEGKLAVCSRQSSVKNKKSENHVICRTSSAFAFYCQLITADCQLRF